MSRPRKNMKHIRNIIETRLQMPEASIRTIARITNCSRPVVSQYLELLELHPVTEELFARMNDTLLAEHLGIAQRSIQETESNRRLATWLDSNQHRLHERYMTRRLLHEEYCKQVDSALQYSQFCVVLKQRAQESNASGMFDHKAGDKLYIDFTGGKLEWLEENGVNHIEEVYLAVQGASSYFFAIPVPNQQNVTFCSATMAAFTYFGGVPAAVVPDCLKSAVLSHNGHEPVHNPLFARMLAHYKVVSIPARPHHPKDKPIAETTVKLVYTRILAKLNKRVFPDRQAMLAAWMEELKAVNSAPFQKLPGSRLTRFETIDKPALKSLPEKPFSITEVLTQTVRTSLAVHVAADETLYSVPAHLAGKQVEIVVNPTEIEIWYQNERHATHVRSPGSGKVINTEHLPAAQKWYQTRNAPELVRALQENGHHVGRWASEILERSEHEDIAWQILTGLKSLASKYPDLIDRACRLALSRTEYSLKVLSKLLSSGEIEDLKELENATPELPLHENIRGGDYFAKEAGK